MDLDSLKLYHPLCGGRVPLASPTPPIGTAHRLTGQPVTALRSRGRRFALTRSKECAARIFIKRVRYFTYLQYFIDFKQFYRARAHVHETRTRTRARNCLLNLLKFIASIPKTFTYLLFGCGMLSINNLKFNKILDYTTAYKTAFREKAGKPKTE